MGTSPLYQLAVAAFRLPRYPPLLGSVAMLWGYFSSAARGASRYGDLEFRRFLRRYQHLALRVGKGEAIRRINEERAAIWESAHAGDRQAASA
jgi:hypothetical protein